jgi:hypothetical protein
MEIKDIRFTRFYAAEHVQFGAEMIRLTESIRPELPQRDHYVALHEEETRILKKLSGNVLTPEIDRSDAVRDSHIYGFFTAVKALQHHYDPELAAAAALKPYKSVTKITYAQESATVGKMITELQKIETAQAIEKLGLTGWIAKIDEDNRLFNDLVMQRNAAVSEKIEGNMSDIRSRIDPVYYDIVKRINALAVINSSNSRYGELILRINERIDAYKHTVAQRQAAAGKKNSDSPKA